MDKMADEKPLNVGVIGYGMSAKIFHIPFIRANAPLLKLHSILQRSGTAKSAADHPLARHHTSLPDFLADPALDLVIVTTPPDSHVPLAEAALEAGKHVLVEKPFAPSAAAARKLADVASSSRSGKGEEEKFLCVFQNRRWDADFLTVRRLIDEGRLGRVVEFETHFDRYRPEHPPASASSWKAALGIQRGGGPVFDLGSHLIDQTYVLFGMPRSVFGKFVAQREPGGMDADEPDGFTALLSYESGLVAIVRVGVVSAEARQPRFWVRGTKGSYRKAGLDTQEPQLKDGMGTDDPAFGRESPEWDGVLCRVQADGEIVEEKCPNDDPPQTYKKVLEGFAKAIRSGRKQDVPVKAEEAIDVLTIIEAIITSAKTGSEVKL